MRANYLRRLVPLITLIILAVAYDAPVPVGAAKGPSRHTSAVIPSGATGRLGPVPTIVQTWNNCGPASIAEVLNFWGIRRTQDQVAAVVRADNAPWGMAPFGVPGYARGVGAQATLGADGTERLIKALVSNGFPVIVSQWVSMSDHVRHYRPIVAYDDRQKRFVSSDPYLGAGHTIGYGDFAHTWAVSDNRFLVIAPPSRQKLLEAVLALSGWNRANAYGHDLAWQQQRLHRPAPDAAGPVLRYYGYPSIAWDEFELGNDRAARQALRRAALQGANPIVIGWINREIAWRAAKHAHVHALSRGRTLHTQR